MWVLGRGAGIAAALVLGLFSSSALGTVPGTNGPIVFSSYGKIHTIEPDGSRLRPVVLPDAEHKYDFYPSWAPDGLRIATSGEMKNPDGYWTIEGLQVFAPDGSGFAHLPILGYVESPAWSPDGSQILFIRDRELLSTTPEGAPPTHIESNAWSPAWSPDGRQIAFVRPDDGPYTDTDLYTVPAGGGYARKILDPPGSVMSPSWSPDGSTIAFSYRAREDREDAEPWELPYAYSGPDIYAVAATGGQPVQLTDSGTDVDPVWSPDGSMIAFQSERPTLPPTGAPDLYLMDADGSNERRLTTTIHCLQCGPDWASLPPHSRPSAAEEAVAPVVEPRRMQKFSRLSVTRRRFGQTARVWLLFRAAVAEKVGLTIRRAIPPAGAFRCSRNPRACRLAVRDQLRARQGLNRISLSGLLGAEPAPGRYWLQLRSSSGGARAGLAFKVLSH